jgi:hypothetical protein
MNSNKILFAGLAAAIICFSTEFAIAQKPEEAVKPPDYLFDDAHFHLTNYVQEGTDIHKFLEIMGEKVGRSVLFGLPLQQTWSYSTTGDFAPTYYLATDDPLYYYSFTDAFIAMAYRSITPDQQKRLDPMITGFNPSDMYAADHIRRVLMTFPKSGQDNWDVKQLSDLFKRHPNTSIIWANCGLG